MARVNVKEALDRIRRLRAALRAQVPRVLEVGIRAGHKQHMQETKDLQTWFLSERYIRNKATRQLGPITDKWQRRKIALGKPPHLGQFTGTLAKAIAHRDSSPRTETGWIYDLRLSALVAPPVRPSSRRGRAALAARRKKARERFTAFHFEGIEEDDEIAVKAAKRRVSASVRNVTGKPLADYLAHYVRDKAPGLGELLPGHEKRIDDAVVKAMRTEFAKVLARTGITESNGRLVLRLPITVAR